MFASVARNGNLRRLESAWALSNLASRASAVAVAVYAYEADGVGAVGVIAFLRLALAAGASPWLALAADRRSRRLVLIVSDLMRCAMLGAMAGLVAYGASSVAVYALAVLVAVAEPVFRSAQAAFTPSLVEAPEELTAANVIASGVESVGLFAGPALGALLLSVAGTDTVFAVTAAVLLATVLLLARIDVAGEPGPAPSGSRREAILAGWHAIASTPALRVVVGLISVQTLVAGLLNVLIVVLALELLDLGTAGVGWLNGVLGLGATLGALAVAGIAGSRRLSGYFTVGLLLWGVPLLLVAAWPHAAPAFVLLALVGIGNTLVDVTGITLMQRAASSAVLSRVFGAFEALALLAMGIGALVAPLLVSELGARGAVLVAGSILPLAIVPFLGTLTRVDAVAVRPSRERLELLRAIPIFTPLPARLVERLAAAAVEVSVEEGSVVFEEDAAGDRFFVIEEGRATVESRSATVRELGSGDFFGEIALLRDVPRTATVRALTPLRLLALDRSTFIDTVTGHATSGEAAGAVVAARLRAPVGS